MNAMGGMTGYSDGGALKRGKTLALANKETLVARELMCGFGTASYAYFTVDSEHSAIYQCLKNEKKECKALNPYSIRRPVFR